MLNVAKRKRRVSLSGLLVAILVFSGRPALAQIAPGVTQPAANIATVTGTVVQSDGKPVAHAAVQIIGPTVAETKSDARGAFSFKNVQFGTYSVVVSAEGLGKAVRANVRIGSDVSMVIRYAASAAASGLKTIAQVSTAAAGAHINVTSSSVSSVTPSAYAFAGNASWSQLLAQIPGVAVSGFTNGGNTSGVVVPGGVQNPVILSVNGALPYETATTLDGMPIQGTSATGEFNAGGGFDLSSLPLNGFAAADVVRGPGANAPSIVDSIGGSFVLHPPSQVNSDQFEFSVANDQYGGIVSNAKVALRLGKLSATFIYGVNDSPGPLGSTGVISAISGTPTTINGKTVQGSPSIIVQNVSGFDNCYCAFSNTLLYCCVPANTGWSAHTGAVALSYAVTPSVLAEVFYAGASSQQNVLGGYYLTEFAPAQAAPPYRGSLAASPPGKFSYLFLGASSPFWSTQASSLLEEKVTAYIGKGVLRLAALQNNTFQYRNSDLNPPNGQYTLWGTADLGAASPGTPTAYNGTPENLTFTSITYKNFNWVNNRDLLGSYAVQIGSSSSAGLSYTTSYYNLPYELGEFIGNTPIINVSQSPATSQTTDETRVHFDSDVSGKLSLGLSWYFAQAAYHVPVPSNPNYWTNSVFDYNAPRFGAVWKAGPDIAMRASAGGGFALPQLAFLTGFSRSEEYGAYYQTSANLNLKPEESFGYDVGTDMRFRRDTVLSLDLFRTNLFGQFFSNTVLSTYDGLPLYLTQFGNLGTSRMEGLNLDVHRDVASGYYWRGTLGFTRGYVTSVPSGFYDTPGICKNCTNEGVVLGPNFNSAVYTVTVPYASASAKLGYRWTSGKFAELSSTYYGSNNIYNTTRAFVELDINAGYPVTRNLSLLATFRNVTGAYDDEIQRYFPSYQVPVVSGAPAFGVAYPIPYGPRALLFTADFKY
jgi:outer membrane receptor protein involved in Fe transport